MATVVGRRLLGHGNFMFFEFEKCVRRKEEVRKVCSYSGRQYAEVPNLERDSDPGSIDPRPCSLAPAQLLKLKN